MFSVRLIAKLIYCSPVWSGLTSAHNRARIDAFLRRSKRYRYCADSIPEITDIFTEADQSLFRRILNNESHVLHQLLPEKTNCTYNLRWRQHNRQLTRKSTCINDSLCFIRMLYKDAYWRFMICICIFFVVVSAFPCYFVAFCQRFIYEYMDGWTNV